MKAHVSLSRGQRDSWEGEGRRERTGGEEWNRFNEHYVHYAQWTLCPTITWTVNMHSEKLKITIVTNFFLCVQLSGIKYISIVVKPCTVPFQNCSSDWAAGRQCSPASSCNPWQPSFYSLSLSPTTLPRVSHSLYKWSKNSVFLLRLALDLSNAFKAQPH